MHWPNEIQPTVMVTVEKAGENANMPAPTGLQFLDWKDPIGQMVTGTLGYGCSFIPHFSKNNCSLQSTYPSIKYETSGTSVYFARMIRMFILYHNTLKRWSL